MKRIALVIEAVADNNLSRASSGKEDKRTCSGPSFNGHSNDPCDEDICIGEAGMIPRQLLSTCKQNIPENSNLTHIEGHGESDNDVAKSSEPIPHLQDGKRHFANPTKLLTPHTKYMLSITKRLEREPAANSLPPNTMAKMAPTVASYNAVSAL